GRVVQERELDREPAEARVGAAGPEDVVGRITALDVLAVLHVDALGWRDVLELEAELQLDGAAPAREIEAESDVTRPSRSALHEQLELALRDPDVPEPKPDAVLHVFLGRCR